MKSTITFIALCAIAATASFLAGIKYQQIGEEQRAYDQAVQVEKIFTNNPTRDYQLEVYEDSTVIFDGLRRVAVLPYDSTQKLDNVIMGDNE